MALSPGSPALAHERTAQEVAGLTLIEGNQVVNPKVTGKDQEQLTTQYTERAVSFIEKNKDKPFFIYVPHSMVHVPLYVSDKFKGKSGAGLFGDVMMEVDWSVGQIMQTPRRHKLEKNTLFIFTSDNGPWLNYGDHAGSAAPLREGKGTMFEGGCRELHLGMVARHHPCSFGMQGAGHDDRPPANHSKLDWSQTPRPSYRRKKRLVLVYRRYRKITA